MTWPRAFLAVPPEALAVDSAVARQSPKATAEELSRWMAGVPKIYAMIERGTTDAEFRTMVAAPASPAERELAETYRHLFSTSPSAQPLRAEVGPDGALTVVAGQHRARAAQEMGVPLVPVHVAAPDEQALRTARADIEERARAVDPGPVQVHRAYDEHWRSARGEPTTPTEHRVRPERGREPGRERTER